MTRAQIAAETLKRLGDTAQQVWTSDEVDGHLLTAYRRLALEARLWPDWTYLENLPPGFSYTADWELPFVVFDWGLANYTLADERRLLTEADRIGPGWYTSPFEATGLYLTAAQAATEIPATATLPKSLTEIERGVWDGRGLDARTARHARLVDSRYELTRGEVFAYLHEAEGPRTLRKIRVPAAQAATFTVTGSWGSLRSPTDISGDTVTGTWGCPRRIAGQHPIGPDAFGLPRRCYRDGTNFRVEHWRHGRALTSPDVECELPERSEVALRDYAIGQCLNRASAGQDVQLAAYFLARWSRHLARLQKRRTSVERDRVGVFGAKSARIPGRRPPVAQRPWQYGETVR